MMHDLESSQRKLDLLQIASAVMNRIYSYRYRFVTVRKVGHCLEVRLVSSGFDFAVSFCEAAPCFDWMHILLCCCCFNFLQFHLVRVLLFAPSYFCPNPTLMMAVGVL